MDYETAISNLADLIEDGATAYAAEGLAEIFDDGGVFDRSGAGSFNLSLWDAITEAVEAAGEDAVYVVDEAIEKAKDNGTDLGSFVSAADRNF